MPQTLTAEAFVLNYNGKDLLEECLPSIVESAHRAQVPCRLTVIDNQSSDGSVAFLREHFPRVNVIETGKNIVLCAFNDAVKNSTADIVILLNNDLKTHPDFVRPLIKVFQSHPDAFLAAPKAFTFDESQYEGSLSKVFLRKGLFGAESRFEGFEAKIDRPGFTMQAGFGAFRRDRFLELGGYDDLYLPGTVEDMDICWRAWKKGYFCYYAPESRVWHKGQATFKRHFGRTRLRAINQRNLYLFMWKNISDPSIWAKHLLWLPFRPLAFLLKGRPESLWGLIWALSKLPCALKCRRSAKFERSDREILRTSSEI